LHVDPHILRVHAKFHSKQTFFLAHIQKTQETHCEKTYFGTEFFHFYIGNIRSRFSLKRFHTHVEHGDAHKTFLFGIF
jgi:hypothetical protein